MDKVSRVPATMFMFKVSLYLVVCVVCASGLRQPYKHSFKYPSNSEPVGDPVFVTPLIEAGRIDIARAQSVVPPLKGNVQSFAGYFTVNKEYQSNLFFWFFPAEKNFDQAPVILWLQGGPGSSSLYGLFAEHGPYSIHKKKLRLRNFSWTKEHSVLYIDNPVGTGYSFTEDERGYAKNQDDVGKDVYNALAQFFVLFPKLQGNDFFVTGESYGGKYVPAVAYTIHKQNPKTRLHINLKGIAIGNGLSDPENQLNYGDYLYQLGLIDSNYQKLFHEKENQIRDMIQKKQWMNASIGFTELIDSDPNQTPPSLFEQSTGLTSYFNYIEGVDKDDGMNEIVQEARVRKAIHVGNLTWNDGATVQKYLQEDIPKSVRPWVQELLTAYRVLIYNGQLDVIVAYPLTETYLQQLDWKDKDAYANAKRSIWRVGGKVAGYVKVAGNLMDVMVRDAGHMVPKDQPEFAYYLIRNFTRNSPLA